MSPKQDMTLEPVGSEFFEAQTEESQALNPRPQAPARPLVPIHGLPEMPLAPTGIQNNMPQDPACIQYPLTPQPSSALVRTRDVRSPEELPGRSVTRIVHIEDYDNIQKRMLKESKKSHRRVRI